MEAEGLLASKDTDMASFLIFPPRGRTGHGRLPRRGIGYLTLQHLLVSIVVTIVVMVGVGAAGGLYLLYTLVLVGPWVPILSE